MDPIQIVIICSLSLITLAIVYCTVYLVKLLQDLRKILNQIKPILSDAGLISSSIAKPVSSISEFIMGFKNGLNIFNKLSNR